jgi:nickel-dependent lactate racemase
VISFCTPHDGIRLGGVGQGALGIERDLGPDGDAGPVAEVVHVLVVLIVGQADGGDTELLEQRQVPLMVLGGQRRALALEVVVPADPSERVRATVELGPLVGVHLEGAQSEQELDLVGPAVQGRHDPVQVGIVPSVPPPGPVDRQLEDGLDHLTGAGREHRGPRGHLVGAVQHPDLDGGLGGGGTVVGDADAGTDDTLAVIERLLGQPDPGRPVIQQVEVHIGHADEAGAAVQAPVEGVIPEQRVHVVVVAVVDPHRQHAASTVQRVGEVGPEDRVPAPVVGDRNVVDEDPSDRAGRSELDIGPVGARRGLDRPPVPTRASVIVVAAAVAVLGVPGVRKCHLRPGTVAPDCGLEAHIGARELPPLVERSVDAHCRSPPWDGPAPHRTSASSHRPSVLASACHTRLVTRVARVQIGSDRPVRAGAVAAAGEVLDAARVTDTLASGLAGRFPGARVLLVVPDHTRSAPLTALVPLLIELLADSERTDVLVALGTHPPLTTPRLEHLVGLSATADGPTGTRLEIAGRHWHASLDRDVPVRVNRRLYDYDHVIVIGPTFPHEVAGFSGGAKYLFPGLSGPEMIDASHWLGALGGVLDTIGVADTPVRRMIRSAADLVDVDLTLLSLVVVDDEGLAAAFVGDLHEAWTAACEVSEQRHVVRVPAPFTSILSTAPPMYDELWTAAKAAYKLEPVLAPGGELIIHAPHLREVSTVHGPAIREVGYHVLDYFLEQWDSFAHVPLAVLAHSSHVRGAGTYANGVERPRTSVSLASRIPPDECAALGLGYVDPDAIDPRDWHDREEEGILAVPRAGETLYRLEP